MYGGRPQLPFLNLKPLIPPKEPAPKSYVPQRSEPERLRGQGTAAMTTDRGLPNLGSSSSRPGSL